MISAAEIAQALGGKRSGKGWMAHCPAHDDRHPSLSLTDGPGGKVLVHCMAGCPQETVIAALRERKLWPEPVKRERPRSLDSYGAVYTYEDADGKVLFQVVRRPGKRFFQRRPDGHGGWIKNLDGVTRVLYRLPKVLAAAKAGQRVYVVEGEKDADNVARLGLVATTNPGGAGKWQPSYGEALRGAHVVILPDKDGPGRKHAEQVARSLHGVAASVKVLELPGDGKDVSDWLAAGGTREELEHLANEAPEWTPPVGEEKAWQAAADSDEPDLLAAATATAAGLEERLKADRQAAFDPEVIRALAVLQERAPAEYGRVKLILQKARIPLRDVERAMKADRRQHLRVVGTEDTPEPTRVRDRLPDAPAPEPLIVPEPYVLDPHSTGVWRYPEDDREGEPELQVIAHAPVLVTGRLRDEEERLEYLRLAWRRPDGWCTTTVDRGIALDSRRLVSLASDGFPVNSGKASALVEYLDRFEAVNYSSLPRYRVSSHLGWQGRDGQYGFLWGCTLITASGETVGTPIDAPDLPEDWREDWTAFRPLAPGDAQIAAGFHAVGTLSGWVEAVSPMAAYPRALLALYASCVPPLLPILQAPNFVVDWSARTSTGKTTALRVAASVWGCPDEKRPEAALGTWDSTKVWVERASAVLHGLPLILDDTKRAKQPQTVAEVLYLVASGRGRGRGNPRSLSRVGTWRTVLLSSGEARATAFTQDGGTRARTLEITGLPFGDDGPATGLLVDRLNAGILAHYGHAGPALVRWLLRHRDLWEEMRIEYTGAFYRYAGHRAAIVRRLAQAAAAIAVAAACLHAALQEAGCSLPWNFRDPLEALWGDIAHAAEDAAPELRALRDVASWAYSHAESFWGRHQVDRDGNPRTPAAGWAGVWNAERDWPYIAFYPTMLQRVLKDLGYEPDAILQGWRGRGWLMTDTDRGRYTKRMRVGNERPHLVVIRREAVNEVERTPLDPLGGDGGDTVGTQVGTDYLPF